MFSIGSFLYAITRDRNKLAKQLAFLKNLGGIQHLEVWLERGDWTEEDSRWLRKEMGDLDCIIHAPFINFSLVGTHQNILKASLEGLKRAVDLSEILQAKVITIHLGRQPIYMSTEEAYEIASAYIENLLEYTTDKIKLSVENLPAKGGSSTRYPTMLEDIEKLLNRFKDLFATVDIGHCILNNDQYIPFFEKYSDRIVDIHLHNAKAGGGDHYSLQAKGDLDIEDFFELLKKVKYKGYITLEVLKDNEVAESWAMLKDLV
jgi:sugar phosphate isomerase/epimerase